MFDGMTMYHHTMNLPKLLVWGIQHRVYPKSLRVTGTSDMQACGTGDLSKSRSFEPNPFPSRGGLNRPALGLANTIGVIGGKSSASTLHFLEKLVGWSMGDGEESLPFIVCSDPVLNREIAAFERSSLPYHNSRNTCSQFDHTPIVKNLQHKRLFLEMSGARCIVMPCHASHIWHKEIWEGSSVPLLHVGECVAQELKAANLKPVETGSNLRIGVLATDSVLSAGFYQKKLENQMGAYSDANSADAFICCSTPFFGVFFIVAIISWLVKNHDAVYKISREESIKISQILMTFPETILLHGVVADFDVLHSTSALLCLLTIVQPRLWALHCTHSPLV